MKYIIEFRENTLQEELLHFDHTENQPPINTTFHHFIRPKAQPSNRPMGMNASTFAILPVD